MRVLAVALILAGCAPSTQITFDLSTDVPCQEIESVGLSVGPVGSVETKPLVATTTSCSPSGTLSAIGTYAVVPAAGPVEVSVRVTLAEKGVSLENACTAENKYKGCIVARRDITFIPRRGLVVPIKLLLVCRDVGCDVNTTCNRLGRCVSSKIDPNKCNGDLCEETVEPFPTGNSNTPAASPVKSTWVANPDRAAADGIATVGLTLTLRDGEGKPVVNEPVSVRSSGGNNLFSFPSSTSDDAGIFLARLASTSAELKTVTVITSDVELQTEVRFTGATETQDGGDGASDGGLPSWAQQAYVKASNPEANDEFGTAIALSADGNTLAVGAPYEDSDTKGVNPPSPNQLARESGAVYVFRRNGTAWTQDAYLKASNTGTNDEFGRALSLSSDGNTLAVGAPYERSNATGTGSTGANQSNNSASSAGATYVFVRTGGTWSQEEYIKPSNTQGSDFFGNAVALSGDGNTLSIGASGEDSAATTINGNQLDDLASSAGAAYIFQRTAGTWQQQAYIKASNAEANDEFGGSIALSADGNVLIVGAIGESSSSKGPDGDSANNAAPKSGAAYVFKRISSTWSQEAYLKASNTRADDGFGISVAISGDGATVAVGSPFEDGNATGINGEQVSVTAPNSGAAYVFRKVGSTWSQEAYVKASNTESSDTFGFRVCLSRDGRTLLVGAPSERGGSRGIDGNQEDNSLSRAGSSYVFRRLATWLPMPTYVKSFNPGGNDSFGYSVALDGVGASFAIGANWEYSNAVGVNGDENNNDAPYSGATYVFAVKAP